jgi:ribonuclease G
LSTDILISSDPWENRVAILEEGRLAEIYVEREERVIGSIYKGKVVNVLPGMGASFVDIGLGRNAFLYVDDINKTPLNIGDVEVTSGRSGYTITEKVSRGDDVLVQIVKEPRGLKGARVSTNISLPGRYLILMPTGRFSGVSRKIDSADERNRLKTIMKAIRPEGMATVVRTAASGVSNAELIADLGVLIRMWHGILEQYKTVPPPSLLHKDMNLVYKTARDFITPQVANVWLDDEKEVENVRDFMRMLGPQYVDRIKYYEGGKRLFADFKIDDEIARLMKPTVKLPSGGSIVIESTEALTVVDVNSGKFTGGKNLDDTIVRTNVEAASEIARQVRLRDIGGIIVCDFIDMSSEGDRSKVISGLQEGLRKDRTRSTIQSFSPLGLLEFTRKRVGKDLGQQLRGKCPTCEGLGSVMSPESVTIGTFREIRTATGRSTSTSRPRRASPRRRSTGTRASASNSRSRSACRSTSSSTRPRIPSTRASSTATTNCRCSRRFVSATSSRSSCSICGCPTRPPPRRSSPAGWSRSRTPPTRSARRSKFASSTSTAVRFWPSRARRSKSRPPRPARSAAAVADAVASAS